MTTTVTIQTAENKVKVKTVRPSDGDVGEFDIEPGLTYAMHIHSDLRISSIEEVGENG
jgi:hypothetical protein